jgi:phage-related protein
MPVRKLFEGPSLDILFWAPDDAGLDRKVFDCPAVTSEDQKKITLALARHAKDGFPNNNEKFKKLKGEKDLFEIKPTGQLRLLGCFADKNFVVVLCIKKKQDKISKADLKKAKTRLELYYAEKYS